MFRRNVLALMSIFSVIPAVAPAYAQTSNETNSGFELFAEVSGNYVDAQGHYEITFPSGWSGVNFLSILIVAPEGFDEESETMEASMIMLAIPRTELTTALWSPEALEQVEQESEQCSIETYSYTTINQMEAVHLVAQCESEQEYNKINMYGFMSEDDVIMALFAANSTSGYDDNVDEFEQSVRTLKVNNAVSFRAAMAETFGLMEHRQQVTAKDTAMEVSIESNSNITEFEFSEAEKRVSFTVNGEDGTNGLTIVGADTVLEGPYTVMIDDEATSNFVVAQDEASGQSMIEVSYTHSEHEIVITGTNVVPEFPLPVVGAIAAVIGVVAVIDRTRLMNKI
ncbi:MAG: hypothetical protein AB1351_12835 [Thermoproteota archaeon]